MYIGYLHRDGLDIYRMTRVAVKKVASGTPEQLKPVKSFGRMILIVARGLLFHTRKKFPPASYNDIKKAVGLEIGEIFPIRNPSFFVSVCEKTEAYTLADVWAWDALPCESLRGVFPFTHIIPEDLTFISDDPEITVVSKGDSSYLLAHSGTGFLGVSSFRGSVNRGRIESFMRAVSRHSVEFKRLNLYGDAVDVVELQDLVPATVQKENRGYPASLENIGRLNIKGFSIKPEQAAAAYADIAMRSVIYVLVAYGLSLLVSGVNYDSAGKEVKIRTAKMAASMSSLAAGQKKQDYTKAEEELKEKLKESRSPLQLMDMIAANLQEKSYIRRITLNENVLDLTLVSNDPLGTVKAMGSWDRVKTVKLKGSPLKEPTGSYVFNLSVDLK